MTTRREFLRRAQTGLAAVALGPDALSCLGVASPPSATLATGSTAESPSARVEKRGARGHPPQTGTGLVYDARYLEHRLPDRGGEPHPERPLRLVRMLEEFRRRGLDQDVVSIPTLADPLPSIRRHHTSDHVASVRRIDVTSDVAELAVGGALGAVDAVAGGRVRNAFCAIRPPGHHANNTGREEGFCFYSNAAIAARYAQTVHRLDKILIVDWDYHHGNATQNAFYDDPSVLFFSTHDWAAYPQTGDPGLSGEGDGVGFNINAHLDCGSRDRDMLAHWDRLLLPALGRFRPDLIIVSAGFDSRRDDLLGCFDLSDDVFRRMTRITMDLADDYCEGRIVSLLEGGYNVDGCALAAAAHLEVLLQG
jgi:acetoin utilization deacetylase AcuC-like enzyme